MTSSYRKGVRTAALGLSTATALCLAAPALAADAPTRPAAEPPAFLQLQKFADGTQSVTLGTAFLNISLAQMNPDGSIRQVCVDSSDAANAILTSAPALEDK